MPAEISKFGEKITMDKLQRGYAGCIFHPLVYSKAAREAAAEMLAEDWPEVLMAALWKHACKIRKEVEEHRKIERPAPLMVMPTAKMAAKRPRQRTASSV